MDTIEILSPDLLGEHADRIDSLRKLASRLGIQLGWHYDLDLAWIVSQLDNLATLRILDAGAGMGVLQWWLADRGASVVSVDRFDRSDLSGRFRLAYNVSGLRDSDLHSSRHRVRLRISKGGDWNISRIMSLARALVTAILEPLLPKSPGQVIFYQHDLALLPELDDNSFDVVVSVSALEHNDPSSLRSVIRELRRVLKPGGLLLVTMAVAEGEDWFHEPSGGWCLSEATLRRAFELPDDSPANFDDYDNIMEDFRGNEELQKRLAPAYFDSGDNGMPWGKWDPKYLPVGIRSQNP